MEYGLDDPPDQGFNFKQKVKLILDLLSHQDSEPSVVFKTTRSHETSIKDSSSHMDQLEKPPNHKVMRWTSHESSFLLNRGTNKFTKAIPE